MILEEVGEAPPEFEQFLDSMDMEVGLVCMYVAEDAECNTDMLCRVIVQIYSW